MSEKQWIVWFERYPRKRGERNATGYGFSAKTRDDALKFIQVSPMVSYQLEHYLETTFNQAIETTCDPEIRKLTGIDPRSHKKGHQYVYWALWVEPEKHWYQAREEKRVAKRKALEKTVPKSKKIRPFSELDNNLQRRIHRISAGCWIWIGSTDENGYGRFRGKSAHRMVYTELVGPIPKGLFLLHKCDNRMCVNPKHLTANTPSENYKDMVENGRSRVNTYAGSYPNHADEYGLDRNDLKNIRVECWVEGKSVDLIARERDIPDYVIEQILEYKINS